MHIPRLISIKLDAAPPGLCKRKIIDLNDALLATTLRLPPDITCLSPRAWKVAYPIASESTGTAAINWTRSLIWTLEGQLQHLTNELQLTDLQPSDRDDLRVHISQTGDLPYLEISGGRISQWDLAKDLSSVQLWPPDHDATFETYSDHNSGSTTIHTTSLTGHRITVNASWHHSSVRHMVNPLDSSLSPMADLYLPNSVHSLPTSLPVNHRVVHTIPRVSISIQFNKPIAPDILRAISDDMSEDLCDLIHSHVRRDSTVRPTISCSKFLRNENILYYTPFWPNRLIANVAACTLANITGSRWRPLEIGYIDYVKIMSTRSYREKSAQLSAFLILRYDHPAVGVIAAIRAMMSIRMMETEAASSMCSLLRKVYAGESSWRVLEDALDRLHGISKLGTLGTVMAVRPSFIQIKKLPDAAADLRSLVY